MKDVRIFSSREEAVKTVLHGKIKLLIIDGVKIGLTRIKDKFYAFDNNCPHQNESLNKGVITKHGEVVCPLHFYRFNLKSGQESNNRCKPLESYPIEVRKNGVYIRVE